MKKILFIMFALFSMQFMYAQQNNAEMNQENIEESILQANAANGITATISGPTTVMLSGGGSAQEVYRLEYSPLISGARYVWSIQGPQAYITPSGMTCSASFYSVGGARLVCDIYVGNEWKGAGSTYVTIRK